MAECVGLSDAPEVGRRAVRVRLGRGDEVEQDVGAEPGDGRNLGVVEAQTQCVGQGADVESVHAVPARPEEQRSLIAEDLVDEPGGEEGGEENLYRQALGIVMRDKKASVSYIQRQLKLGYNRAARLIDRMEEEGHVGPANHVGKREVLAR